MRKDLDNDWLYYEIGLRFNGFIFYTLKNGKYREVKPQKIKDYYFLCISHKRKKYNIMTGRAAYSFYNGFCPANMDVIFKDNDKKNLSEDNLVLISHKDLLHLKIWDKLCAGTKDA